jgi:TrmH family RNA methyltransferase
MNCDNVRVVLVSTRNPLNIGAAARAMRNFGFSRLRVVNPYDVAFREARSAVDAADVLQRAEEYTALDSAVADCSVVVGTTALGHRELNHTLRRLEHASGLIREAAESAPVALLFGSEKFGLSNDELSHCQWLTRIPTVDQDLSMNLGQAVAVCLYELIRDPAAAPSRPVEHNPASADDAEQITRMLLDVLEKSGYINPVVKGSTENKIRRLVRRLNLTPRDAPVALGVLRQVLWKIGSSEDH